MIICTTARDMSRVEFIQPPKDSVPGDKVYIENNEGTPDLVLNPKKCIFESLAVDFNVKDDLIVRWKEHPFVTSKGYVYAAPGFADSMVS